MKLLLAYIYTTHARPKSNPADALAADYVSRAAYYLPTESRAFPSEAAVLSWVAKQSARSPAQLILLDGRGIQLSSEGFAERLGRLRDSGIQMAVLAIGPADGWSAAARARADLLVSFGPITLPHSLARVVLAEQVYRALTILAGHPYHSGH